MRLNSKPMVITTTDDLEAVCNTIANTSKEDFIAIDTEFHRERTYYPILCLFQIAWNGGEAIIDPLAKNINLDPIWPLLADESITKVFHSASQDLEIICNLFGDIPKNSYDTQIAASVCGFGQAVSLAKLTKTLLHINSDKSKQFSNWQIRPLSPEQLQYAVQDVIFTKSIYPLIRSKVNKHARQSWISEELAKINEKSRYEYDSDKAWERIPTGKFTPRTFPVLKRLAKWWDEQAKLHNVPRKHILREEAIKEISQTCPTELHQLMNLRTAQTIRLGSDAINGIFEAVQLGMDDPLEPPPTSSNNNFQIHNGDITAFIMLLLKRVAKDNGVSAHLIANREEISMFVDGKKDLRFLSGWRKEIFGNLAIDLLSGKICLRIANNELATSSHSKQHD